EPQQQNKILEQWQSLSQLQDDSSLPQAPWTCADADDQIFLDLAFQLKPAILISKDNALLTLASRAAKEDILITANYDSFKIQA
ncbi:MAG: PIN domain-containing protein, partial [Polynucleobacter sp. 16-46-70]